MNINWFRFEQRILKIVNELIEPALNQNNENKLQIQDSLEPKCERITKKFEIINEEFLILKK